MKFTIITIVWNGRELLEGTFESVATQTFSDFEYLVIDGGSTDGTVDFLIEKQSVALKFNYRFLTEKDNGLYDAMNKGLRLATGEFVCFLNAGDHLFETTTLEKLAKLADDSVDLIYGETMLVDENRRPAGTMSELSTRRLPARLSANSMQRGMVVVHQSVYLRRQMAPFYDLSWKLCADIDWLINCLKQSRKTVNSGLILTNYLMGGMSKRRHRASLKERFLILKKHFGLWPTLANHGLILLRAGWHRIMRFNKRSY